MTKAVSVELDFELELDACTFWSEKKCADSMPVAFMLCVVLQLVPNILESYRESAVRAVDLQSM